MEEESGGTSNNSSSGHQEEYQRKKKLFAVRAAVAGSVGGLLLGYDLGVISDALPSVTAYFGLTTTQQELATSLMLFGCVLGALTGGSICDYFGRKMTVFIVAFMFLIGSIVLALSYSIETLFAGRVIIGVGVAIRYPSPITVTPSPISCLLSLVHD